VQTILNLLTRDGAVYMAFAPHLTSEQYGELLKLSEVAEQRTKLEELVQNWARANGLQLSLDEASELPSV
jgi:hypothetical protein